ncbi:MULTISPECIES: alpha/beta hydrolase [Rhodomicrobium]|uniref:alpha/beta fold hydrolase n=1 Tax=Rhodomicrobium TaxID=1068 RepID=UPI000B4B9181|nr:MULTISPECIES: alpha/beta hydrolase [Rhodomicrobium]
MELVGIARNPVPNGAVPGSFVARDGVKIRYALWPRTADKRLGTVCLFGGRGEFIEKYFETITDLRRRGFAVAMMDWRGQGGSDRLLRNPRKGHVEDFADYDNDLRQFMAEIVLPDCPAPFYGVAHSMGAHILLRSALTKVCWFDRIMLSAPMIDINPEMTKRPFLRAFIEALVLFGGGDFYVPGGRPESFELRLPEAAQHTSDPLRLDRVREILKTAPWLTLGSPTIGWLNAAARSIMHINSFGFASAIRVPILIVAAGNDTVVSTRIIEQFSSQVKTCRLLVIAGARHEILQERAEIRDQFWAAFDAYVPGSNRTMSESQIGL